MNNSTVKTGLPRRNGQILRNVQSPKIELEETENMNRTITSNEIESVI